MLISQMKEIMASYFVNITRNQVCRLDDADILLTLFRKNFWNMDDTIFSSGGVVNGYLHGITEDELKDYKLVHVTYTGELAEESAWFLEFDDTPC